jgi:hypothetical protein
MNSLLPFFIKYTEIHVSNLPVVVNAAKANGRQIWRYSWRCRPRNWTDGSGGVSALRPLYLQQSLWRCHRRIMVLSGTVTLLLSNHTLKSVVCDIHNPSSVSKVGFCNYRCDDRIS